MTLVPAAVAKSIKSAVANNQDWPGHVLYDKLPTINPVQSQRPDKNLLANKRWVLLLY